ncbi:MAG: hypothetical protein IJ416_04065 [Ruminiclostridium sp.]|nr:hypothetical protein [Ruminiclostridium sp.]
MKKLKFRCPFRGYHGYVAAALFLAVLGTIMINNKLNGVSEDGSDIFVYILMFITVVVVLSLSYLIINHETADDRLMRESAQPPVWTEIEGWEKEEILAAARPKYMAYILLSALDIVLLLVGQKTAIPLFFAILIPTLAVFAISMLNYQKWSSMDSTAIRTVVPIYRTYTIAQHVKRHVHYYHYHEIYTTEGKIVLPHIDRDAPAFGTAPDSKISDMSGYYTDIIIVKYKNMIEYIEV